MARYIDAEKFIEHLKIHFDALYREDGELLDSDRICIGEDVDDLIRMVNEHPTADVAEVKHGYWKDRFGDKYDNHLYECSVCGKKALYEVYSDELQQTKIRQVLSNACPHCLAKMDGKENNHEKTLM